MICRSKLFEFAIWRLDLTIRDFDFFKHVFNIRSLLTVSYSLILVIRETEIFISVGRDPLSFRFMNRARDPPTVRSLGPVHTNPFSNENEAVFFPDTAIVHTDNAENDHRKRSHSKTLSRVERF